MSFLDRLKAAIGLSNGINDASKAKIDEAMTQFASDISDACKKLDDTINAELGLFRDSAGAVEAAAGEFQGYADMVNAEAVKKKHEAEAFAALIVDAPDVPGDPGAVRFTPV